LRLVPACLYFLLAAGCDSVEWNWDLEWWREPRRVVRPTRPGPVPGETQRAAEPAPPEKDQAASTEDPTVSIGKEPAPAGRAFLQLYFRSPDVPASPARGERTIVLRHARARTCAAMLEWLCVPLGRSGSLDECYLLYEEAAEFQVACELGPLLDVSPITRPAQPVGPQAALQAGIGLLAGLIEQPVGPARATVEAAERRLSEALQSERLPPRQRWVAGVLAGRVAAEFRYDDAAARSYCQQALRLAPQDSLEHVTALYWMAEAHRQEGREEAASELYGRILGTYGVRAAGSAVVRGAREHARRPKGR
jgi:tetratricopeptide (TPR) repeat protein